MSARLLGLTSILLLPLMSEASRIKMCGSVLLPPGQTFSSGELTVNATLEKVYLLTTNTNTTPITIDPANLRFCYERNNDDEFGLSYYKLRVSATKTSQPAMNLYTGNFTIWNDGAASSSQQLLPDMDYDFYLDVVYLGASDPLARKIFFPGLIPYDNSTDAEDGVIRHDSHSTLNKIVTESYSAGNLLRDGSFEEPQSRWRILGPVRPALPVAIKASHGNRALVLSAPSLSGVRRALSDFVELKPLTTYTLSFYYKTLQISGDIRPALVTYADKEEGSEQVISSPTSYSSTTVWTQFTQTFTTEANAGFGRIALLDFPGTSPGSGVIAFDDVVLLEGTRGPAMEVATGTTFFDGLNRPLQSMQQVGISDIYTQTIYDEFGRKVIGTLPIGFDYFRHNGRHAFLEGLFDGAFGGHLNYYYGDKSADPNIPGPNAQGYPYQHTIYEASPLGRVSRTLRPGGAWRGATLQSDHDVRSFYGSVTNGQVLLNDPGALQWVSDLNPGDAPEQFLKITQGENGEVSRTFTDLFGQTIRTDIKFGNSWITTRYHYDALGNVVLTTPPPGPNGQVVDLAMEYNSLNQPLSESSLDLGVSKSIYDRNGKLRFSQSKVQQDNGAFTYLKYDDLDRVVESGEYLSATYFTPEIADDATFPFPGDPNRKLRTANTYDAVPVVLDVCNEAASGERIHIAAPNGPVPRGFYPDLKTAYDETRAKMALRSTYPSPFVNLLQFVTASENEIVPPPGTVFEAMPLANGSKVGMIIEGILDNSSGNPPIFGTPFPFPIQWGRLKGKLTKTTVCNQGLAGTAAGLKEFSRYFNYDKYGNITHIYEYNGYVSEITKRWQKSLSLYDAQNRLAFRGYFESVASLSPLFRYAYSYDASGRLDKITDLNGDVVARMNYNLINQVDKIFLGKSGAGQVTLEYGYHFQGWIQKITAKNAAGAELFNQTLKYEDGTSPRFDGTIAGYNYSLVAGSVEQFAFGYDPLGRLTSATTTMTSSSAVDGGIWGYQYARNGAITRMSNTNQAFQYEYGQGNRLDHVVASGIPSPSRDFSGTGTFSYDMNGRMTVDNSKQMDIEYDDVSHLATAFNVGASATLKSFFMAYDDGGNRISKLEYQGAGLISAKHYTSFGKETRYGAAGWEDVYPFESYGRSVKAVNGAWRLEGYVRNHLGSTTKVYNLSDGAETYSTDYDPYGKLRLETAGPTAALTEKFTGKEFDNGIDLDYFGARYYDADLAVWISPDAARQYGSPYAYSPNPVNGVDPDGNYAIDIKNDGSVPGCVDGPYNSSDFEGYRFKGQMVLGSIVNFDATQIFNKTLAVNGAAAAKMYWGKTFYDKIKTGGDWDFKNLGGTYGHIFGDAYQGHLNLKYGGESWRNDDFGNYHFGYTASRLGWPRALSLAGAGAVQFKRGLVNKDYPVPWRYWRTNFDEPGDQGMIKRGYGN